MRYAPCLALRVSLVAKMTDRWSLPRPLPTVIADILFSTGAINSQSTLDADAEEFCWKHTRAPPAVREEGVFG